MQQMLEVMEANRESRKIVSKTNRRTNRRIEGEKGNGIDTGRDDKVGERHDDVMSRRKRTLCRVAKGVIPYSRKPYWEKGR